MPREESRSSTGRAPSRGRSGNRARATARGRRKQRIAPDAVRGRVRAHDPFELIRWLALSQPDPRKALAELVQNSLDAAARHIRVTRVRIRGTPCLRILDDGEGVIPEMDRPEALRFIATHIGHSRKRSLSPEERLRLLTQGQYGIGLLGFWSLGAMLEMRTAVPGHRSHKLNLYRDRADFLIEPLRGRLPLEERWTEVMVVDLHREAMTALVGRRAADYLASELRGQLLARDVELVVEDRMARGRAQKLITVRPPRFLGERLEGIGPVEVPGHAPIRFEVYLTGTGIGGHGGGGVAAEPGGSAAGETAAGEADSEARGGLAVYAAGTMVAESFHGLAALGLDRPPWNDARLTGMVDFPGLRIAPGSRRGVVFDQAASAFAAALQGVEPILLGVLENLERRRVEEMDRTLIRDLQRAFRDFYRQRPRYAMLPVEHRADQGAGPGGDGARDGAGSGRGGLEPEDAAPGAVEGAADSVDATVAPAAETPAAGTVRPPDWPVDLFPPGPLAVVRITPATVRVECGGRRRARARCFDASGRAIEVRDDAAPAEPPLTFTWSITPSAGTLAPVAGERDRIELRAPGEPAAGVLAVVARQGPHEARAEAAVEVLEEILSRSAAEGIPQPEFVDQPGALWRSRMLEGRWQVNAGHREYRTIADRPALKLRYLALLFAKEVVLRSHHDPRFERPLEQIVEVFTYADRNLARKRQPHRRRRRQEPPAAG